ncbi:MAG: hypothetical protein HY962_12170 [Ignavibacteriae bacterium]|nr:hypothetical protein [Ignavibacteriota bacterium]
MKILACLLAATALFAAGCEANPEYPDAPVAGLVTVVNESSDDFQVLRFRVNGTIDWSKDYLGSGTTIPSGESVTYYMPVGTFDFLAENTIDRIYVEFKNITITRGQETTLTIID